MTSKAIVFASACWLLLGIGGCADVGADAAEPTLQPRGSLLEESSNGEARDPMCRVLTEWSFRGCRGAANRVCKELVNRSYLQRNPSCQANTLSCEGSYWDCNTALCPVRKDGDYPHQSLMGTIFNRWDTLTSEDGTHRLTWQGDGNLVLRRVSDQAVIWNSGTANVGSSPELIFQSNGDLQIQSYNGSSYTVIWSTGTRSTDRALVLEVVGGATPGLRIRTQSQPCDFTPTQYPWKTY